MKASYLIIATFIVILTIQAVAGAENQVGDYCDKEKKRRTQKDGSCRPCMPGEYFNTIAGVKECSTCPFPYTNFMENSRTSCKDFDYSGSVKPPENTGGVKGTRKKPIKSHGSKRNKSRKQRREEKRKTVKQEVVEINNNSKAEDHKRQREEGSVTEGVKKNRQTDVLILEDGTSQIAEEKTKAPEKNLQDEDEMLGNNRANEDLQDKEQTIINNRGNGANTIGLSFTDTRILLLVVAVVLGLVFM